MDLIEKIKKEFVGRFNSEPQLFIAPGRINLIGEHTDYNEGFVMPAAIDRYFVFAMAPNSGNTFRFFSSDYNQSAEFALSDARPGESWVHYLMGVLDGIHKVGFPLQGVDCVFGSNVPVGAGLSSSAALCCGFGFGVSEVLSLGLARLGIAKIAQYSEHHFAGVKCGIMDQYASLFGEKDSALLLDCKSLTHEILPASFDSYQLILVDTKVKHSLASTAYNDRRAACEEGVRVMSKKYPHVQALRDVSQTMLYEHQDALGEEVFVKCRFVVDEIARTQQAASFLKSRDWSSFGVLMYETHWGLSKSYEVSCEELDFLVSLAEDHREFVIGSRMMGGGFGGCTISLVKKEKVDYFKGYAHEKYFATFEKEPDFYHVSLSEGVHKLNREVD